MAKTPTALAELAFIVGWKAEVILTWLLNRACIEGLRRLSVNFVDNRALEYIHEPRRWV